MVQACGFPWNKMCRSQMLLLFSLSVVPNSLQLQDHSPPGSSVHGISQARILEWFAIPFSRESSQPRDQTCISSMSRWILYH